MNDNYVTVTAEEAALLQVFAQEKEIPDHMRAELVFQGPGCADWRRRTGPGRNLSTHLPPDGGMNSLASRATRGRIAEELVRKGLLVKVPYGGLIVYRTPVPVLSIASSR